MSCVNGVKNSLIVVGIIASKTQKTNKMVRLFNTITT